jgi:DNA-binding response OmpR family regulator
MNDIHIVMITDRSQQSDKEKGWECGADGYLVKPIKTEEIAKLSREVLGM